MMNTEFTTGPKAKLSGVTDIKQLVGRKALSISVYRNAEFADGWMKDVDCTCNGVTKRFSSLLLLCEEGPTTITEADLPRVVALEKHPVAYLNTCHIIPVAEKLAGSWTMAGGNYAGTSDSRLSDFTFALIGTRAGIVSVHDRVEK